MNVLFNCRNIQYTSSSFSSCYYYYYYYCIDAKYFTLPCLVCSEQLYFAVFKIYFCISNRILLFLCAYSWGDLHFMRLTKRFFVRQSVYVIEKFD